MAHDKRARFLGRRARAVLEGGVENAEWELDSVVSHSTRSSAGSTAADDSAGSSAESTPDEGTVKDDGTEDGDTDVETAQSNSGNASLGDAMEIDTVEWNEDAEASATRIGEQMRAPITSYAASASALASDAFHRRPCGPVQDLDRLCPPATNFGITITPSPSPEPPIVFSLTQPIVSEPVSSRVPLVSPSASAAFSPSISPVSSVRSGLVERPRPLQMAGSVKILKRSLSAISIGKPESKTNGIGGEKSVLNEEGTKTRLGARGSSSQNHLGEDEDEKAQCSEKTAEVDSPTLTQADPVPESAQIQPSTTICLARRTEASPVVHVEESASLRESPGSTLDSAAREPCDTPTSPRLSGGSGLSATSSAPMITGSAEIDQTKAMHSAFVGLWGDLTILTREVQELSIAIEKSVEAGRKKNIATSGAQVGKKPSIHELRQLSVVADAVNTQPIMNEVRETPTTLVDLETAHPSVRPNPDPILCDSPKLVGLTKGVSKTARSLEIQSEQPRDRFWKDEYIGQWVATSAIPSEKTRTSLLTKH